MTKKEYRRIKNFLERLHAYDEAIEHCKRTIDEIQYKIHDREWKSSLDYYNLDVRLKFNVEYMQGVKKDMIHFCMTHAHEVLGKSTAQNVRKFAILYAGCRKSIYGNLR